MGHQIRQISRNRGLRLAPRGKLSTEQGIRYYFDCLERYLGRTEMLEEMIVIQGLASGFRGAQTPPCRKKSRYYHDEVLKKQSIA
jgi:hypothetical protein